jgi:hypothetical protein
MAEADANTSSNAGDDVVMATVREFVDRSGAARVAVLLDRGEGHAVPLLECLPGEPLSVTQGDETFLVDDEALRGVAPLPVGAPKPVPASAIEADAEQGRVAAPLGAVEALVAGVRDLARALGGRSVAMADFPTRDGEPLSIAAREGEPAVLAIGDQQFELPG